MPSPRNRADAKSIASQIVLSRQAYDDHVPGTGSEMTDTDRALHMM